VIRGVFGDHSWMITARVLMFCTFAAASACHKDSPPPAAPKPHVSVPVAAKKGPSVAELTAGMVEAVSQGKSILPVELKFDLKQRPTPGQALDVDIAVIPRIDASAADIQVTGGDGLTVAPGTNQFNLPVVESGQVYRQNVKVTPTTDGVLLLSLTITLKHDEMTESRAFSIPLIVER
jgi:hypothetical protein